MEALVWVIGGVVLVDVSIVAWFVVREVLDARRARRQIQHVDAVRREIEHLDALWRAPAVPQLRSVHSRARWSPRRGGGLATVTTLERPMLAGRPRARQASFAAFAAAMVALLVVLAFDAVAPGPERASAAGGSSGLTWSFDPQPDGDRGNAGASDGGTPSVGGSPVAPPPTFDGDVGTVAGTTPAPDRVAADATSTDRIVLEWVPVPEASGYLIERWDEPVEASAGWTEIGRTEADATSFTDSELEPGTTYYYRVSAVTDEGTAPSDVVSATTLPGPPTAPVIVATANGATIKVEWVDVGSETGYRIERADPDGAWAAIATVGQDVTLYVDGGLDAGTTYSYRVVATNEYGESPPSNVASATAGSDPGSTDPGEGGGDEVGSGAASVEPIQTEEILTPEIEAPVTAEPTAPIDASAGSETSGSPTTDVPTTDGATSTEGATPVDDAASAEPIAGG